MKSCFASRVVDGGCSVSWFLIDSDVSFGKTTDCFAYLAITDEGRHETTTTRGNGARGYALFMNEVEFNKASNRKHQRRRVATRTYPFFLNFAL